MLKSSIIADLKQLLDHAPLIVDLSITLESICIYRMVFKYYNYSKEKVAFFLSISEELSKLNFYTLDSFAGPKLLSKAIYRLFTNCWTTYVKKIIVTT